MLHRPSSGHVGRAGRAGGPPAGAAQGRGAARRAGPAGALSPRVDWCWSTLLNLVIQTSFQLTVAACRSAPAAARAVRTTHPLAKQSAVHARGEDRLLPPGRPLGARETGFT